MAGTEPIDPRVRLAIAHWPADAPRGAVSTFCAEHGISRTSFTHRVGGQCGFHEVFLDISANPTTVIDTQGESSSSTPDQHPGITYVGNGKHPGPPARRPEPSPKS